MGGCVRDMLLTRTPHDWDVCTSASPQQVIDCFADVRVLTTGLKHGTVTALLNGESVEITTYRIDGDYTDHRHPNAVQFTSSLREDLARRDFTINAMAFRPDTGIIDYYGGKEDLRDGLIRCVGNPDARFSEDALRMLRALRFASRFSFVIEPETADALLRHRLELRMVASERVLSELIGIDYARLDARYLPVLQAVIPELTALDVPAGLPADPAVRLAALLHGQDAGKILRRLKASTALADRVALLVSLETCPVEPTATSIRHLLRFAGPEAAGQLLILRGDDASMRVLSEVLRRGDVYALRQLDVNGNDLIKAGLHGKAIGDALEHLLTKVIDGELPNERHKLLRALDIAMLIKESP